MSTFNRFAIFLFLLALVAMTSRVQAAPKLYIKPDTCVRERNTQCQMSLEIVFEDNQTRSVCISMPSLPHEHCPEPRNRYQLEHQLEVSQDLTILVVDEKSREVISQTVLKVATFKPEATRKRRRFSWSF